MKSQASPASQRFISVFTASMVTGILVSSHGMHPIGVLILCMNILLALGFRSYLFGTRFFLKGDLLKSAEGDQEPTEDLVYFAGTYVDPETDRAAQEQEMYRQAFIMPKEITTRALMLVVGAVAVGGTLKTGGSLGTIMLLNALAVVFIVPAVTLSHFLLPLFWGTLAILFSAMPGGGAFAMGHFIYFGLLVLALFFFQKTRLEDQVIRPGPGLPADFRGEFLEPLKVGLKEAGIFLALLVLVAYFVGQPGNRSLIDPPRGGLQAMRHLNRFAGRFAERFGGHSAGNLTGHPANRVSGSGSAEEGGRKSTVGGTSTPGEQASKEQASNEIGTQGPGAQEPSSEPSDSASGDRGHSETRSRPDTDSDTERLQSPGQQKPTPELLSDETLKHLYHALIIACVAFILGGLLYLLYKTLLKSDPSKIRKSRISKITRRELRDALERISRENLPPRDEVIRIYQVFLQIMEAAQRGREPYLPPDRYREEIALAFPMLKSEFLCLTEVFSDTFYGEMAVAKKELESVRKSFQGVAGFFL